MQRWPRIFGHAMIVLTLVVAVAAIVVLRYNFRDYPAYFLQKKGALTETTSEELSRTPYSITYRIHLKSSTGLDVEARLRTPVSESGPLPGVLVVSGIETGHLVIRMLDERPNVVVMAIRYPYDGEPDFSGWRAIPTLLEMRETGMKTIPSLLLAIDYLRGHPLVDTSDLAVATVSFGTFLGVPAATLHPAVTKLIVVQGGGDVAAIIAANAERLQMPLPPKISGWLGKMFLYPFEPNRYIGDFSPRSLLMVNSPGDLLFPDESARSLFQHAREPKEIVWHRSTHVMPGALEIIKELTDIVIEKLYMKTLPPR